jgi:type II secretory pathway pseudopilin PulG
MTVRQFPRRGVTFVEVLLLVAFLLFLAAVLLPALFQVRRAASQTMSMNNLRQLALAAHNYHDANRSLPPAVAKIGNQEGTCHFYLLPYLEQENIFRKAEGAVWKNNTNNTVIPLFLDPDDPSAPPGNRYKDWLATTNYAVNWMISKTGGVQLQNIPDGTSNTLMFATRYQMCNGNPTAWGYPTLYYWSPVFAYYSHGKFQNRPGQDDCDPALAQAYSKNGILVAMCDGSVRTVDLAVSPHTWGYLCDPADGNVLGDDF